MERIPDWLHSTCSPLQLPTVPPVQGERAPPAWGQACARHQPTWGGSQNTWGGSSVPDRVPKPCCPTVEGNSPLSMVWHQFSFTPTSAGGEQSFQSGAKLAPGMSPRGEGDPCALSGVLGLEQGPPNPTASAERLLPLPRSVQSGTGLAPGYRDCSSPPPIPPSPCTCRCGAKPSPIPCLFCEE